MKVGWAGRMVHQLVHGAEERVAVELVVAVVEEGGKEEVSEMAMAMVEEGVGGAESLQGLADEGGEHEKEVQVEAEMVMGE